MITLIRFFRELCNVWRMCGAGTALRFYVYVLLNATSIIRSRKFYAADLRMKGETEFRLNGKRFSIDLDLMGRDGGNPFAGLRELIGRDVYFRAFDTGRLRFDTCVDIGANVGLVSEVLSNLGDRRNVVIAIEAAYSDHAYSRKLCERHANIRWVAEAVLDGNSESAEHWADSFDWQDVTVTTMPEIVDRFSIERISFLKVDIEGSEFSLLTRNDEWLGLVDNLALEVHPAAGAPSILVDVLRDHGFSVIWTDEFGDAVAPEEIAYLYGSRTGALLPKFGK